MSDLFDFANPISHKQDPSSSAIAAEQLTSSGRRARGCRLVLNILKRNPGCTAVELWDLATAAERSELREMQRVRQRLTDLLHAGLAMQGPQRACRVRGSTMVTWKAAG